MEKGIAQLTMEHEGYYLHYENVCIATTRPLLNNDIIKFKLNEKMCNRFNMKLFDTIDVSITLDTVITWNTHGYEDNSKWTIDNEELRHRVEYDGYLHVSILNSKR